MYLPNKYTKWYNSIITRAKSRVLPSDIYIENHHIIPESFFIERSRKGPPGWIAGNPDSPANIVTVTAHEHFVCHLLLTKMTTGLAKSKASKALWKMVNQRNQFQSRVTGRSYELSKKLFNESNPFKSAEVITMVKERMTYNNPMKNPEVANKVSVSLKGKYVGELNPFYRKTHSEEFKQSISGDNHYTHWPG
jgi:hypothetical protein